MTKINLLFSRNLHIVLRRTGFYAFKMRIVRHGASFSGMWNGAFDFGHRGARLVGPAERPPNLVVTLLLILVVGEVSTTRRMQPDRQTPCPFAIGAGWFHACESACLVI